ncbi:CoA-binding protein [Chroococcidiopsis sp. CCNUC1]|uniref:CoA-binding protein n=1 Tax=Chroococcidiopsis sp. CCNUC1 TaxID=2653189 RepID=UPI00201FE70A|nr:CoA-binding protein [Chroococcidiopsis sp. CCNUC1]URD51275.1 CoA-binding protein [Chroococcidiopsis sp. CCNUC1]
MSRLILNDNVLQEILTTSKVIAVVGHSDKPERTSYQIAQFLRQVGYTIIPVNPSVSEIDGQRSYASLQDIPEPVDIVNVFRRREYVPEIVEETIAIRAKTIWTQLGIYDAPSAQKASSAGLNVVMNACIKIEYYRLGINHSSELLN